MTVMASCAQHNWEIPCRDEEERARRELAHQQRHHGVTPEPTLRLAAADWRVLGFAAVERYRDVVDEFTLYEAMRAEGVPEPPRPQFDWGNLAQDIHRRGLVHPVAWDLSKRQGTNASSVRRWSRDASRCERQDHRPAALIPRSEVAS